MSHRLVHALPVALLALAACEAEPGSLADPAEALAAEALPMPQPLDLDITNPLVPGDPVDITVTGLQPGVAPVVARSNGVPGAGPCPSALGGSCLDITPGTTGYSLMTMLPPADPAGVSSWSGTLPPTVPTGGSFAFQAVVNPGGGAPAVGSNPLLRGVTNASCAGDVYEPNDTLGTGFPLGALPATVDAATCGATDVDHYLFDGTAGEVIDITGVTDLADGDVDFYLIGPGGTTLAFGYPTAPILGFSLPSDGTYALQVVEFDDTDLDGAVAYSATINSNGSGTPCPTDVFEPNDDAFGTLFGVQPGDVFFGLGSCLVDRFDWYRLPLVAGQEIQVVADHISTEGDIDLYLTDAPVASDIGTVAGASVAAAATGLNLETLTYTAPTTGDYYLLAYLYSDGGTAIAGGNTYDLSITDITP